LQLVASSFKLQAASFRLKLPLPDLGIRVAESAFYGVVFAFSGKLHLAPPVWNSFSGRFPLKRCCPIVIEYPIKNMGKRLGKTPSKTTLVFSIFTIYTANQTSVRSRNILTNHRTPLSFLQTLMQSAGSR
jgi:hypothetical protein